MRTLPALLRKYPLLVDFDANLRLLLRFCLVFFCSFALPPLTFGQQATHVPSVTVVSDDNYPPYIMRENGGAIRGILVDQWKLWEEKTGIAVTLVSMDWGEAQRYMAEGKADVIDTMFLTEKRAKLYDFSRPWARIEVPIFFQRNIGGISDAQSLHGFTVGVKEGDAAVDFLKANGITTLELFPSYEAIVRAAADQKIRVFCVDSPPARYFLYKFNLEQEFRSTAPLYTGEFHRAVRKGNTALLRTVEEGFAKISAGEYASIERRWMGTPVLLPPEVFRPLLYSAIGVGLLALALILWNYTLRRQVALRTAQLHGTLEAQRQSEAQFRLLAENANDVIWTMDESERFTYVSPSVRKLRGYTPSEVLAQRIEDVLTASSLLVVRQGIKQIDNMLREGIRFFDIPPIEVEQTRKDGSTVWTEVVVTPLLDEAGQLHGILGVSRDISERKRLGAEREAAMQRLKFVVSVTRTGFDMINADYDVRYVDPARMKVLGDYQGRKCYEYFRGRSSPCDDCAMIPALATHRVAVTEWTSSAVDTRPSQVTAIPFQTETGEWMVAEVVVDISERKRAEAERLELERRILSAQKLEGLGILAGGVAHNFNNLLAVMLGYAQLLRDKTPGEVDFKAAAEQIIKAGFRSRDLIGQLLAIGRRKAIDLVPLDLNQVIADSRAILRQAIRENIELKFRLASAPCPVMADTGCIEQMLLNLALNAQDAILREGTLIFETAEGVHDEASERRHEDIPPGRYILLTVRDSGVGMDRETMDKIFDPFFTTKKQGKGTGLGLSTVYGIVKQHSGSIEVESEPGHGTRFTIYLPRTDTPLRRMRETGSTEEKKGTETLLLVEDQDPVRVLLRLQLQNLGYTVLEAASGAVALRIAVEHKGALHLLLTDVILEDMNGRELYALLARERGGIRVLYISGYTKGVLEDHGVAGEGVDFLQKPFDMYTLAAKVRGILDRN